MQHAVTKNVKQLKQLRSAPNVGWVSTLRVTLTTYYHSFSFFLTQIKHYPLPTTAFTAVNRPASGASSAKTPAQTIFTKCIHDAEIGEQLRLGD